MSSVNKYLVEVDSVVLTHPKLGLDILYTFLFQSILNESRRAIIYAAH